MLAVDTNVLVYAADADSQFHGACRDWLERQRARPDAWYTTWASLYEFLRVTTRASCDGHGAHGRRGTSLPRCSPRQASQFLPRHNGTPTSPKRLFWSCRTLPAICSTTRTPILMREHGIGRICTRDTEFNRFPFLE